MGIARPGAWLAAGSTAASAPSSVRGQIQLELGSPPHDERNYHRAVWQIRSLGCDLICAMFEELGDDRRSAQIPTVYRPFSRCDGGGVASSSFGSEPPEPPKPTTSPVASLIT